MSKMTPEVREAIETALRMSSVQTFGRGTVYTLMRHIEGVEWENESLIKASKHECVDQIRKVTLPREVADAIVRLKSGPYGLSNFGIIALSDQTSVIGRDYDQSVIKDLKIIRSYPLMEVILQALVNGYTVEQTPEDRIEMKISSMLFAMNIESPFPVDQLAKQLTTMLRDEIAESSKSAN